MHFALYILAAYLLASIVATMFASALCRAGRRADEWSEKAGEP